MATRSIMVYGNIRQQVLRALCQATVLLVMSLVLQVAGCVSPGWLVLKYRNGEVDAHIGLWYIWTCIRQSACKIQSVGVRVLFQGVLDDLTGLSELRGETVSGIIVCVAAIIAVRITRKRLLNTHNSKNCLPLLISGLSCLLTGILATTAAGTYGDKINKAYADYKSYGFTSPYRFPYSLFITGMGGVFGLIAFFLLLASQPWKLEGTDTQSSQQYLSQPGSNPAQMIPMQTISSEGQPQVYTVATVTILAHADISQAPPSYYEVCPESNELVRQIR